MTCTVTESQLFSWIDREAPELEKHLAGCPECRQRSIDLRGAVHHAAHVVSSELPPLPEKLGVYRILGRLGSGGQGWVFEAEQPAPHRRVALKVVRGGTFTNEQDAKRLKREADLLARLKHPHIATIYEAGQAASGEFYIAIELVRGEPLLQYARTQNLSLEAGLRLFCKVCRALSYAHQQGIIHRDLKPSNILVEPGDVPKILDFGLAQLVRTDLHQSTTLVETGKIMGTLRYMSPEHARGKVNDIDARSDTYSLAVILYELVTEQPPYTLDALLPHEALRVICEQSPNRPARHSRRLATDLETIVLKGLEKDPARRYDSTESLAEDIESFLTGRPISARRPSFGYHLRKLIARNRALLTAIGVVFFAAAGIGTWIGVRYAEARAEQFRLTAPPSPDAAAARIELAELARSVQQFEKAELACQRALLDLRQQLPEGSSAILSTQVLLGRILIDAGKLQEADSLLRETVQTYLSSPRGQRGVMAEAQAVFATCLVKLGLFEEAEAHLVQSYPILQEYRGPSDERTIEALRELIALYDAWKKPDKAALYRSHLEAALKSAAGNEHESPPPTTSRTTPRP